MEKDQISDLHIWCFQFITNLAYIHQFRWQTDIGQIHVLLFTFSAGIFQALHNKRKDFQVEGHSLPDFWDCENSWPFLAFGAIFWKRKCSFCEKEILSAVPCLTDVFFFFNSFWTTVEEYGTEEGSGFTDIKVDTIHCGI